MPNLSPYESVNYTNLHEVMIYADIKQIQAREQQKANKKSKI